MDDTVDGWQMDDRWMIDGWMHIHSACVCACACYTEQLQAQNTHEIARCTLGASRVAKVQAKVTQARAKAPVPVASMYNDSKDQERNKPTSKIFKIESIRSNQEWKYIVNAVTQWSSIGINRSSHASDFMQSFSCAALGHRKGLSIVDQASEVHQGISAKPPTKSTNHLYPGPYLVDNWLWMGAPHAPHAPRNLCKGLCIKAKHSRSVTTPCIW